MSRHVRLLDSRMQREFQSNAVPVCTHCGSRNAEGLRFCQDCGQKLASAPAAEGATVPPLGPGPAEKRPGIPDTGARASAPLMGPVVSCPRCRVDNRPGMNFCKMCGALLPRPADAPPPAATRERTVISVTAPSAAEPPPPAIAAPTPPSGMRAPAAGAPAAGAPAAGAPAAGAPAAGPPAAGAMVQALPAGPTCARCRGANTPGAEFCRFCGTPLAPVAPVPDSEARDTVVIRRAEGAAAPATTAAARPGIATVPSSVAPLPVGSGGAAAATQAMGATMPFALAQLTTILRDGSTGAIYPLTADQTDIGREEGNVLLPDDPYICARHARVVRREGRFLLRDLHSVNGVYLRIGGPVDLKNHDAFLVGQQLMVFELTEEGEGGLGPASQHGTLVFGSPEVARLGRLTLWTTEGVPRDVYTLHRQETILGREVGDIVFPEDAFMSRRHAAVTCDLSTHHFTLRDLDSSNGTFVRFRGEREIRFGDRFRIGQHLFRFDPMGAS